MYIVHRCKVDVLSLDFLIYGLILPFIEEVKNVEIQVIERIITLRMMQLHSGDQIISCRQCNYLYWKQLIYLMLNLIDKSKGLSQFKKL